MENIEGLGSPKGIPQICVIYKEKKKMICLV